MWAVGFPAAEILLHSWGAIALVLLRQILSVGILLILWIVADGLPQVVNAPWRRGVSVGSIGFGFGAILLMVGQKMSDPVTPAIAAAMMPIAGAALEVAFDGRRFRPALLLGIVFALAGGLLATGVNLADSTFGVGALLCLVAVFLFAWATRATTRNFSSLSPIGQTTITLVGGMIFMMLAYVVSFVTGYQEAAIGKLDFQHLILLMIFSFASLALAQLLWIWSAGRLGILLASFHMNAVPFYVMVTVVLFLSGEWNWMQAIGAAFVALGVVISQLAYLKKS